jgi:hypothetical protein
MRRLGLLLAFILLAGCNTLKQMNTNLEESNENLRKNTETVAKSSDVISSNSKEIARTTETMWLFGLIFPIVGIILIAILFYPSFVLLRHHRRLHEDFKLFLKTLKKR